MSDPGLLSSLSRGLFSCCLLSSDAGGFPLSSDSRFFGGLTSGFSLCSFLSGESSSLLSSESLPLSFLLLSHLLGQGLNSGLFCLLQHSTEQCLVGEPLLLRQPSLFCLSCQSSLFLGLGPQSGLLLLTSSLFGESLDASLFSSEGCLTLLPSPLNGELL